MKRPKWMACAVLLAGSGLALGQEPPTAVQPASPAAVPALTVPSAPAAENAGRDGLILDGSSPCSCLCCCRPCGPRIWGSAEYLLWWIKDGPLPVPLATTGDIANPNFGAIGEPDTRILFGDQDLDYGTFSGMRGTLGGWFDEGRSVGIEASAFLLERQGVIFGAESNPQGLPPLLVPFFDLEADQESGVLFANPNLGFFLPTTAGGISVTSFTRFWGAEANFLFNAYEANAVRLDILTGFRHLSLNEEVNLYGRADIPDFGNLTARVDEHFDTRNRFYGGQLGGRFRCEGEFVALMVQAMVALGGTYQAVDINGNTVLTGGFAPPANFPGAIFTQASNLGSRNDTRFGVVPSVQVQLAFRLLENVRATVGYDFLYWDSVARPGDQIDRVVNLSQSPVFGTGTLVGPARPLPLFERSDFFAHGVSFGLECRY